MTRTRQAERLLLEAGWGAAERRHLAGDASDRSYERLSLQGRTAVLMDAPPGRGDDPRAFIAMAGHLQSLGLSAPMIIARDLEQGFLLLEDLGDAVFAREIAREPSLELPYYLEATQALLHIQAAQPPAGLANLTATDWAEAAAFALDWYRQSITGDTGDRAGFVARMTAALEAHANGPRVLILRDYHAENLLWLPGRPGVARVGLLDFQLGQLGQPAYDLVSLLQDARRDVSCETSQAALSLFRAASGQTEAAFSAAVATLGAQRALRILGVFARLCIKGGKPGYLRMIPRVWAHLLENLAHPALAPLARICLSELPEPTADRLRRIAEQCPPPAH